MEYRTRTHLWLAVALAILVCPAFAGAGRGGKTGKGAAAEPGKKREARQPRNEGTKELTELTVVGTIEEKETRGKPGRAGKRTPAKRFVLVDAEGNHVLLPSPRTGGKKAGAGTDLAEYVGKRVRVIGMGTVETREREGVQRKSIRLRKILNLRVEEQDAPEDDGPVVDAEGGNE